MRARATIAIVATVAAGGWLDWPAATTIIGVAGVVSQAWLERRQTQRAMRGMAHRIEELAERCDRLLELGKGVASGLEQLEADVGRLRADLTGDGREH